ncbi:MAG: thiamine phosphate synthase, partial [Candidatus Eremiobacteraeota bacterium]|nr:thiamine phosphate synthase [Candidatus Eremiobacteraeota bacterium]
MAAFPAARVASPPLRTRAERAALLRGVYLIVNEGAGRDPLALTHVAVDAGVRIVPYRAKAGIVAATLAALRRLTRERSALLLVNDDVDAAVRFDCDGVHLGPDDAGFSDVAPVRSVLGERL